MEMNLLKIYKFNGESNQYKLTLLPGKYTVVYRAKSSKKYIYTDEKTFVIKSGKSQLIKNLLIMEMKDTRSGFGAGLTELGKLIQKL